MKKEVIHPDYENYAEFVDTLPDIFPNEGVTIFKARNEVKLFKVKGKEFIVKSFKIPHIINKIAYSLFRASKAERSYTNAIEIGKRGSATPAPVAYIEIRKCGLLFNSFYISRKSRFHRELRELCTTGDSAEAYAVLDDFAKFSAHLHDQGIYHKDYTPGNILFGKTGDNYEFELVDLNRMKYCKIDLKTGCKIFHRLCLSDDFYRHLAQKYALARGFDVDDSVRLMLKYRNPNA